MPMSNYQEKPGEGSEKVQPKFKTEFLSQVIPDDERILELKHWCSEFIKSGLMPSYETGAYGNLSFRIKEGSNEFIITSSGLKDPESKESFARVSSIDFEKQIVYAHGKREPSSESMFHFLIYQNRPDVNAIFHGHCDKLLKCYEKLNIPCTKKEEPYGTIELANQILDILDKNNFLIIKNHGFISLGSDMDTAGKSAIATLQIPLPPGRGRKRKALLTRKTG